MKFDIRHEIHTTKGAFFIERDGTRAAEMTYSRAGDTLIIIDHTEVSEQLKGTGTGKALVKAAVEMAREKGIKIMPLCPFANAMFRKMPEWGDVLQ
ncbi:MAG: N-acetyltransferase [Balneolaceae bacterium]|nr:MAG: N-acetyltransferase [Balneolaceae bacterium]